VLFACYRICFLTTVQKWHHLVYNKQAVLALFTQHWLLPNSMQNWLSLLLFLVITLNIKENFISEYTKNHQKTTSKLQFWFGTVFEKLRFQFWF